MSGSGDIGDTQEVWPDYAKALTAFEAFREKRPGGSELARHRQALKEIRDKTKGEINTAYVQRFVHRKGEAFEIVRSSNPSRIQYRNLRQIVAVMAPDENPLEYIDWGGVLAAKIRREPDCKCSARGRWLPTEPRYLREGWVSFLITPQANVENVPLDVSIHLSSVHVKIPETEGTPPLRATVTVSAGEILLPPASQPVPETIFGVRPAPNDLVKFDGVRWNFTYPREANAPHPLDRARLCELRVYGLGPHRFDFKLRCRDIDLHVEFLDHLPDVDTRTAAILARLIQKLGVEDPDADYVDLATAGLALEESE